LKLTLVLVVTCSRSGSYQEAHHWPPNSGPSSLSSLEDEVQVDADGALKNKALERVVDKGPAQLAEIERGDRRPDD
jgi:hypothetical protein